MQAAQRRSESLSMFRVSSGRRLARRIVSGHREWRGFCGVVLFCVVTVVASPAQTFTTLATFNGTDGSLPLASLVQGLDGNLYGTTLYGGSCANATCGTVFKV